MTRHIRVPDLSQGSVCLVYGYASHSPRRSNPSTLKPLNPRPIPPLRCLLVDDEPLAHRVLASYIAGVDYLDVADQCYDGLSALNRLAAGDIDVVFLDIQMPDLTGLELLDALRQNAPLVVLTTAYTEYAVDSFGYDQVVDYLHKPIKLARFLQTAERLKARAGRPSVEPAAAGAVLAQAPTHLTLQDDQTTHRVALSDLRYVESYGNYVKAHLTDGKRVLVGRRTMKDTEAYLAPAGFLRVHKRYLVNAAAVTALEGGSVRVGREALPVGKAYAEAVRARLG